MGKLSRRKLLKMLITAGGLGLASTGVKALAQTLDHSVYLPLIVKSPTPEPIPTVEPPPPPPTGSRVVHVYDPDATSWNFSSSWYGNYVDQNAINTMVAQGITALTGIQNLADAWRALIPYQSGEGVAIKVNFNNAMDYTSCAGNGNTIDAVPQPIIAIIAGLISIGVPQNKIWIFDAMRKIPTRFRYIITSKYPNVLFYEKAEGGCAGTLDANFATGDSARIDFSQGMTSQYVPEVLVNAAHLINVPIMKKHWLGGVSLGFKHHFGTIHDPGALHLHIDPSESQFSYSANPLVDIYQNTHIMNKTRLILADGLFCCLEGENQAPSPWTTFNDDVPNSLFFSTDPVAVDCVMCDFLNAERPNPTGADNYLRLAEQAGLGTFEQASSPGTYNQIDYWRYNL